MRAFFLALLFALAPLPPTSLTVDAALVQRLPRCSLGNGYDADKDNLVDTGCPGSDQFTTAASGHYNIDVNSCGVSFVATLTDANANGGDSIQVPTATGVFPSWQMRCLITPAAGTYTVRVMVRSPTGTSKLWMATAPMQVNNPPGPAQQTDACNTAGLCDAKHNILNYGWVTMAQTIVSSGAQVALYLTAEQLIEINCIDITTTPGTIAPSCPSGVVPPTPFYRALKVTGATPTVCNDVGGADTVDWSTGYNQGLVAPQVKLAWKAGSPAHWYLCVTTSDPDIVAPTTADDDSTIYSGNDYLEWTLTPPGLTTDEGSVSFAINPATPPAKLDGKVTAGVWSTTPDYNMSCAKTGTWSVFCSGDFDFAVADNQFGLLQMIFRNVNASPASNLYAIMGGTNPLGANDPTNWKAIIYSSTALPAPPADSTPPVVGTPTFANVTTNAMQVQFTVTDAESAVSSAFADYDSDSGGTYCNAQPGSGTCPAPCTINSGVATCSITGLAPATSYYVRGRATSTGGTGVGTELNQVTATTGDFYFNVTTGNDANPCTIGSPCKSLAKMVAVLAPGKKAILQDGTWFAANGTGISGVTLDINCGTSGNAASGTIGNVITVQAEHSRMARIDHPSNANLTGGVHITGDGLSGPKNCQYWVLDGLVVIGHDTGSLYANDIGAFTIDSRNNNNTIRNSVSRGGNSWSNGGAGFFIVQANGNLIENNEVYNCHRNCFEVYGNGGQYSANNIFRGNYAAQPQVNHTSQNDVSWGGFTTPGPNDSFVDYSTAGPNTWEGNIADMGSMCSRPPSPPPAPQFPSCNDADYYMGHSTGSQTQMYGDISIITLNRTNGIVIGSVAGIAATIKDSVVIGGNIGINIDRAKSLNIANVGVFDSNLDYEQINVTDADTDNPTTSPLNLTINNSLTTRQSSNHRDLNKSSPTGMTINATATNVRCDNPGGNTCFTNSSGSAWTLSGTTTGAVTGMGACKVFVPSTANIPTTIGPNLLYAYENGIRQDGTGGTVAKPLWDATQTGANYGKWRYAGAVIAGVNSSSTGNVASTVHQRLGFGGAGCNLPAGYGQPPNVRLGLHVTTAELSVWRTRSTSGPYKTAGDVSTNSPGDYDRIVVQAITGTNPFLTAPTADRWDGANLTPASGCLTGGSGFSPDTSPGLHLKMLSAAFYILLNPAYANRQTIANNIATELLYEAGQPNLSFVNTRWCPTGGTNAVNPFFGITAWVARLAQTYDMLRAAETLGIVTPMSTANRNTIEAWFHLAGIWARDVLYVTTSTWFSDAGSVAHDALPVNFTNAGGPCGSSSALGANATIYVDGSNNPSPTVFNMHLQWNNRQGDFMWLSAVIGLVLQNVAAYTTDANDMIARAKQWDKEWIAYGTQADGTPVELYRWLSTNPDLGYSTYGSGLFQSAVNTANIIARAGDTSMMDWTTTATLAPSGGNCTVTNATTKSLHSIATTMAKYVDHTITRFIPGHAADNQYRIDTTDPIPNENRVSDVYWLPAANLYWNDAYLKTVYMRTASGAPAYPSSGFVPNGTPPSGITGWNGNDAPLPGLLFMFGQMEGVVNPYP